MNTQKIAVTAASGRLGAAIINELKKVVPAGNIIGLARSPEKARALGVETRKADYNSKEEFLSALKGVDVLLVVSGTDDPDKRITQNRNIIAAAKERGVKKLVYTSVIGPSEGTTFSAVVNSNRQTEEDVKNSGLQWAVGRNGVYIEADLEYVESYKSEGGITNCAGDGKCGYTSRQELAYAYARILTQEHLQGETYNLVGEPITQSQLASAMNKAFDTNLEYISVSIEQYTKQRRAALGDRIGSVIAGIYAGIKGGEYEVPSDFYKVAGRQHLSVDEMIGRFTEHES